MTASGAGDGGMSGGRGPNPVRIGVLGPMEVLLDGEDLTPSAPMTRRTLAVLLLHANRVVPLSTLIDELWEGAPPRLARKTVQTYVYQLRQLLGPLAPDAIETRGSGYVLRLEAGELDLWEFERMSAEGRRALEDGDAEKAAVVLGEALDFWRGSAFADIVAPGPMLSARIAQVDDSRLHALELRIESELRLGRHRSLLGELFELTAIHPLHEEFTAQLMRAAYRSGRPGMALSAFTRLRSRLVEELGLEPSQRLCRLQQEVLSL
ncbi:AfsR/SARP family transcriptional regulator [Streptomyces sp. TP-A0874]|uniref:AfsR/SARP family transcriptional regulator n=1 Tax=Streptomyces sp. TP-A0874 TaxID=549819 RepID=UPI000D19C382|nr:AfsR/SARP family transcriptional regulator [Streptomyces sp. TP-A0874]